ncbi:Poly(rC)-binding protein 4 [Coemansia sp. RSA 2681]|nr:Poly(rC)-binding protein 4 [Coemansia sp. RSA 2681]
MMPPFPVIDTDCDIRLPRKAVAHADTRCADVADMCCAPNGGKNATTYNESGALRRPATPGSASSDTDVAAALPGAAAPQTLLRLLFLPEDGGMLIGKEGCHINKLKASTTATWSIAGSNTNSEDRVVVISSSTESVVHAVHALAEHMDQQQRLATINSGVSGATPALTLRLLFPASCIGLLIGPGGARISKLRADSKISHLHIYRDSIWNTDERVIEISGTRQALCSAVAQVLRETGPSLPKQQAVSVLYKPVHNGFRRLQSRERHSPSSETRTDSYRPSSARDQHRSRSSSLLGLRGADSSRDAPDRQRQKRRMSDNLDSDYKVSKRRVSEASEAGRTPEAPYRHDRARRASPPQLKRRSSTSTRSSYSTSSSGKGSPDERSKEEKLVIPDSIAGRLIGRKGSYLLSLETQSGAQITLSPRVQNMPDRVVTVVGRIDEVSIACRLIRNSVQNFEDLEA